MSKIHRIGIISEDSTDFETLKILISKIIDTKHIGFKSKVGNGCAKIRSKCTAWAEDLNNRKCDFLLVVHDLDRRDYDDLNRELTTKASSGPIDKYFISIPIEELEAWLIADANSIKKALNLTRIPKFSGLPETITSPKEKLGDQIYQCSNKEIVYQTSINPRLAHALNVETLYKKCPSFQIFCDYLKANA